MITADLELADPTPSGETPASFWLHGENRLPHWRLVWWVQNVHGRRYRERTGAARGTPSGSLHTSARSRSSVTLASR